MVWMLSLPSVKTTSALTVPPPSRYAMLNSMMNWRFGALPIVAVKMPWPRAAVFMSSQ